MKKRDTVFILVNAFLLLALCSMTSFLFPIHNRVDQNCFMTIGKGILNGQVPYRDLFEQKGPIIYFIHAVAAFTSDTSYIGVFILQYIFLVVLMIYMRKIACLFLPSKYANLIVLLTTSLILTTNCYLRGDNVEEYVITLMTVSIFYTLNLHINKTSKAIPNWIFLLNGLFIGFVLWIKFNLLGYWVGWALFTFVPILIKKNYRKFITYTLLVMSGIVIISLPWIIYFGVNNAIYDLFYTYFYCNIFLYSKGSMIFFIYHLLISVIKNFSLNPIFMSVITLGIIKFFFTERYIKDKVYRRSLLVSFVILYLGVFFQVFGMIIMF